MGEIMNKTKGKVKQAVGALTGNRKLQQEGKRARGTNSRAKWKAWSRR